MTVEEIEALISGARIREMHDQALVADGGLGGERIHDCVDAALGNAISGCLYTAAEAGSDLDALCFLAHLMRNLNSGHCFNDGNKRVVWMIVDDVLLQLELRVDADQAEAAAFVRDIATEKLSPQAIVAWFIEPGRLVPLQMEPKDPPASPTS